MLGEDRAFDVLAHDQGGSVQVRDNSERRVIHLEAVQSGRDYVFGRRETKGLMGE